MRFLVVSTMMALCTAPMARAGEPLPAEIDAARAQYRAALERGIGVVAGTVPRQVMEPWLSSLPRSRPNDRELRESCERTRRSWQPEARTLLNDRVSPIGQDMAIADPARRARYREEYVWGAIYTWTASDPALAPRFKRVPQDLKNSCWDERFAITQWQRANDLPESGTLDIASVTRFLEIWDPKLRAGFQLFTDELRRSDEVAAAKEAAAKQMAAEREQRRLEDEAARRESESRRLAQERALADATAEVLRSRRPQVDALVQKQYPDLHRYCGDVARNAEDRARNEDMGMVTAGLMEMVHTRDLQVVYGNAYHSCRDEVLHAAARQLASRDLAKK